MLSAHDHLPLQHMSENMVIEKFKKYQIAKFQVGYMSYPGLNHNKAFKDQFFKTILKFDKKMFL